MEIKILSLSDEGLAESNKSFKVYMRFLMNRMTKGIKITTPEGDQTLRYSDGNLPMFFHKGMVGNLRSDARGITCREALTHELRRQFAQRVGDGYDRIYLIHLRGNFGPKFTNSLLTNFITDFVVKRDGRLKLLETAIEVNMDTHNSESQIIFTVLVTYVGDGLTSAAMLTWFLRNGQSYILNTRNNYDSLEGVFNRFKKSALQGPLNHATQSLLLWMALFLTPRGINNQIMAIDNFPNQGDNSPNGPVTFITKMNLQATMQNILYTEKAIDKFSELTDNFSEKVFGKLSGYKVISEYKKYTLADKKEVKQSER